jgi:hypothetical protein
MHNIIVNKYMENFIFHIIITVNKYQLNKFSGRSYNLINKKMNMHDKLDSN